MKSLLLFFLFYSVTSFGARIVVVGDIHGDYERLLLILNRTGLVDPAGNWSGGKSILVQTGDQIDRGMDDKRIIDFFESLKPLALAKGGMVFPMLGNHEIMNSLMDFTDVHDDALGDFKEFGEKFKKENYQAEIFPTLRYIDKEYAGRAFAFAPGGPYAKILASRKAILIFKDILFVHGGVLPKYASKGIESLNQEAAEWLDGTLTKPPEWMKDREEGPLWLRAFSKDPSPEACNLAKETLRITKTNFMIVGHSIQKDINSVCDGKIWRIDTAMSRGFGKLTGTPQALVIDTKTNKFEVIKAN